MRASSLGPGSGDFGGAGLPSRRGRGDGLRARAPELTEVGAGISLWANALRALDYIGAGPAVRAVALPMQQAEFRVRDGYAVVASHTAAALEQRFGVAPLSPWFTAPSWSPPWLAACPRGCPLRVRVRGRRTRWRAGGGPVQGRLRR